MSSFNLNIKDTFEKTSKTKKYIQNYKETINTYLKNILNVDSVWCDSNTDAFLDIIKKDKSDINEHIDSLENYVNLINDCCIKIQQTIKTHFNTSNINFIRYDLSKINVVLDILDVCYERINENSKILSNLRIPFNFKYKAIIDRYKDICYEYKSKILRLRKKINGASYELEKIFSNSKQRVNNFDVKFISKNICSYKYRVINISLNNAIKVNVNIS